MTTEFFPELDGKKKPDKWILSLLEKGLIEAAYSDKTGDLCFSLTEKGKKVCQELFGEMDVEGSMGNS